MTRRTTWRQRIWRGTLALLAIWPFILVPVGIFTNPLLASRSELSYVSMAAILAVVALATGLFVNLTGLPSVAQAGLWGVAAYAGGAAMTRWNVNFWASFLVAISVATLIALPGGALALRTRGLAFLIVTLAFSEFLDLIMENARGITGGYGGMPYPGQNPMLGPIHFMTPVSVYFLNLAFPFIVIVLYWLLRRSQFGRRLEAVRENENLARSLSINAYLHRLVVFEISAALTALAGPLILLQQQVITPSMFSTGQFLNVYLMIMVGGLGTIAGPAVGAWIVQALPEWLSSFGAMSPTAQHLMYAALLVVFVLAARRGVLGFIRERLLGSPELIQSPAARDTEDGQTAVTLPEVLRGKDAIDEALAHVAGDISGEVILKVNGLSHAYGANKVLDDVEFDVRAGEVRGLIGPNGSGKTTTLNCVSGFVRPSAGDISFRHQQIYGRRFDAIAGTGLVRTFQQPELFDIFTARQTIELALQSTGALGCGKTMNNALPADPDYYLRLCLLTEVADRPSADLPYGHARLVGVAAALATRPYLLMLDEPAAGLGALDRIRLTSVIREARRSGVAVMIVDHDMSFLLPLCDRLTVLDYGKKIAEGEPRTVCRDPHVIAAYLGTGFAERHSQEQPEVTR